MLTADEKKQRVKELTDGVNDFYTSGNFIGLLNTLTKHHNYSPRNRILIDLQEHLIDIPRQDNGTELYKYTKDGETITAPVPMGQPTVGSFNYWKSIGRPVTKGESAKIYVFAPAPIKKKEEVQKFDENGSPCLLPDGTPEMETKEEIVKQVYKLVPVYHVSQTIGEPLIETAQTLTFDVNNYDAFMKAVNEISPCPIRYAAITDGSDGYFSPSNNEIVIKKDLPQAHTLKTALHELAHAILHNNNKTIEVDMTGDTDIVSDILAQKKTQERQEIEAEATAYLICKTIFGDDLDPGDFSFGYVASWASSIKPEERDKIINDVANKAFDLAETIQKRAEKELALEHGEVNLDKPTVQVYIGLSESPKLPMEKDALTMSFAAANEMLKMLNNELRNSPEYKGGYDKTDFKVVVTDKDGEQYAYEGRYDIGDESMDLADHIKAFVDYAENDNRGIYINKENVNETKDIILPAIDDNMELTDEDKKQIESIIGSAPKLEEVSL